MPDPTIYRLVRHALTSEVFALRMELNTLTGVSGPLPGGRASDPLADLPYEDHPDDLEWFLRTQEHLRPL